MGGTAERRCPGRPVGNDQVQRIDTGWVGHPFDGMPREVALPAQSHPGRSGANAAPFGGGGEADAHLPAWSPGPAGARAVFRPGSSRPSGPRQAFRTVAPEER